MMTQNNIFLKIESIQKYRLSATYTYELFVKKYINQ